MSQKHNLPESAQSTDPEFAELVNYFVGELPARIRELEAATEAGDLAELSLLTHRLKGCASGFGFPEVGKRAGAIEAQIKAGAESTAGVESLRSEVGELIALCRSYFRQG